jgi:hypothetical protein
VDVVQQASLVPSAPRLALIRRDLYRSISADGLEAIARGVWIYDTLYAELAFVLTFALTTALKSNFWNKMIRAARRPMPRCTHTGRIVTDSVIYTARRIQG